MAAGHLRFLIAGSRSRLGIDATRTQRISNRSPALALVACQSYDSSLSAWPSTNGSGYSMAHPRPIISSSFVHRELRVAASWQMVEEETRMHQP